MKHIYKNLFLTSFAIFCANFASSQVYSPVPYTTGFETGSLDASWTETSSQTTGEVTVFQSGVLTWSTQTALSHTGNYFLGMHNAPPGGAYNLNTANLHLDMTGATDFRLSFWWAEWNEETEPEDGVYISDDGGTTYVKVLDLNGASYTDLQYVNFNMSLDSINTIHGLTFTSTYVIRFQQYDNYYFAGGNDGFLLDDISIFTDPSPCTPTSSAISVSTCDNYTVPSGSNTYSTSGIYVDVIPNSEGCDSTITIDLTVNNSTSSITNVSSCVSYTWTDGNTYTSSGSYDQILTNSNGCDSTATLELVINDAPGMAITSSDGINLVATGNTVSYQWINCVTLGSVVGTGTANFTALSNGSYAVVGVTADGCQDTSSCFTVISVGVLNQGLNEFNVYPNPANDILYISGSTEISLVKIYSVTGELVLISESNVVGVNTLLPGTYFATLQTQNETQSNIRFVKQ